MDQIHAQGSMQLLLEMSNKLGSLVRNDGFMHAMQTQDTSKVQLNIFLSLVVDVHQNEMRKLGELIHDHPYGIILVGRERQTHNDIHADVFSFSGRNFQSLHQFVGLK
jgi:hypothetical protein